MDLYLYIFSWKLCSKNTVPKASNMVVNVCITSVCVWDNRYFTGYLILITPTCDAETRSTHIPVICVLRWTPVYSKHSLYITDISFINNHKAKPRKHLLYNSNELVNTFIICFSSVFIWCARRCLSVYGVLFWLFLFFTTVILYFSE